MAEFAGLAYYAEVPAVIFDVQRLGPSTGLPTRTAQGDFLSTAVLSHGDTRHLLLIPGSAEECYTMAMEAFDLAERFQTPVFVMTDLDMGMNHWMSRPFEYPTGPVDRGKVLTAEKLAEIAGTWGRYADVDGDAVAWRTIPGDGLPASFTRGTGHNARAQYSERGDDYVSNVDRLARKFETARASMPKPDVQIEPEGSIGLVAFGSSHVAAMESRDQLREEAMIGSSYLRLRSYPFTPELLDYFDRHDRVYVIEQNRDAQMAGLMRLELSPERIAKIRSVLHYDGLPIDARSITSSVLAQEGRGVSAHPGRAAGGATGGE
jgi:2-oxoglutarate/2-oxoacid ferredoxin oxidoreductase subunit alpha